MEINEYRFGFGRIDEILQGDVDREESTDSFTFPGNGGILVPGLIGVYQDYKDSEVPEGALEFLNKAADHLLARIDGRPDGICPELICLAYDPSVFPLEILKSIVYEKDTLDRVKIVEYYSLEDIDFSQKSYSFREHSPGLRKDYENPGSQTKIAVAKAIELLSMLREDYGLMRTEAMELKMAKKVGEKKSSKILSIPCMPELTTRVSEEVRDMDLRIVKQRKKR